MARMDSIKLSTIVALTTDIGLILIMLLGLIRLRRRGGGIMALGRLLWNQVWLWHFLNTLPQPVDVYPFIRVSSGSCLPPLQGSPQQ